MSPKCGPSLLSPRTETFHNHLQFKMSPKLSSELQPSAITIAILDGSSDNSTRLLQSITMSVLSRGSRKTLKFKRVNLFSARLSSSKLGNYQTVEPMLLSPILQYERSNVLKNVGKKRKCVWWFMLL